MATTLSAGDLAVIGINADNPDAFSFVLLVDIEAGTEIFFTDNGVFNDGSFRTNEGIVKYTAATAVSAGTVIEFTGIGGDFTTEDAGFDLSASGDQVIAYQGTVDNPIFIYAAQTNSTEFQVGSNDAQQSDLPPGLTVGTTAVAVGVGAGAESEVDNSTYNESLTSGTQAELLAAISNAANWNGDNNRIGNLADGPFIVTDAGGGGTTITLFEEDFQSFDGSGFAPTPTGGQLDSDAWRATGFSDGNGTFGGTFTSGDFARGADVNGGVSTGGVYAFDTGGSNSILGIQPGGSDFTPGTITLRLTNTTGSTLTSLDVAYDIFFNNDQPRANSLNFAFSTDDVTYTSVSALDFTTPEAAAAGFQSESLSATISGLSIADGSDVFLQWQGDDVSGSGSRDEYGIDNVVITTESGGTTGTTIAIAPDNATQPEGNSGTTDFTFTVSRSGDTTGTTDVDFAITLGDTDAADFSGNTSGTVSFAANETTQTITLQVAGDTDAEPDETFTVTLSNPTNDATITTATADGTIQNDDGVPLTLISDIQGSGAASPLDGQTVTIEAIVVGDFQDGDADTQRNLRGFYLQEEDSDADSNDQTSEGIFVFENGNFITDVNVGDRVRVTGTVDEFFGETQIDTVTDVTIVPGGNSSLVTPATITFPVASTTTNSDGELIADLEAFEGMLVTIPDTLTVADLFTLGRFGDIGLYADGRLETFTQANTPSVAGFQAYQDLAVRNTIVIDDGSTVQNPDVIPFEIASAPGNAVGELDANDQLRAGDTTAGLTGVVRFSRGSGGSGDELYRINPTEAPVFANDNPRPEQEPDVGGRLTVASFNVLNFFTTLDDDRSRNNTPQNAGPSNLEPRGANDLTTASSSVAPSTQAQNDPSAEFNRQVDKLVAALSETEADIFSLIELENEFGDQNGDGEFAISFLVDELNTAIAGANYQFVDPRSIDPNRTFIDTSDAISVGLIYNANTVSIAEGTTIEILTDSDLSGLGVDPGVPVFDGPSTNRAPLAVTFEENATGEVFTVAVNHLKSKGSPGTAGAGDLDQGDGVGAANQTRLNGAIALDAWLDTDPTGSGDEDFLIIGDLNAYGMEDPIQFLSSEGYGNQVQRFLEPGELEYSFGFPVDLNSSPQVQAFGALDYALATSSLADQITGAREWHINADEASIFDYNLEFRPQAQADNLYAATPFRSADHDPIIVGLELSSPNSAPLAVDDAANTDEDETVEIDVLENDNDPDGDTLTVESFDISNTSGIVTDNGDGTFDYDPNGFFTYLAAGETATDEFSYTVTDGEATDTAVVTITVAGPDELTNSGTRFSFRQSTNGGANRFGFDGDSFFISGQGVPGRPKFDDFDDFLEVAAGVFDGVIESSGNINDQRLPDGDGPNGLRVNANDEVIISGSGIGGSYRIQFGGTHEAENFLDFVERMFDEIDANDAVATNPTDFRFDALTGTTDARLFFDDVNDEFGFTTDGGATQVRFDTLEEFVEGVASSIFGGNQLRDGNFNAERIADGQIPNQVRVTRGDRVIIGGRSVGGRFEFGFADSATANFFAEAVGDLFGNIQETGAIAMGDI